MVSLLIPVAVIVVELGVVAVVVVVVVVTERKQGSHQSKVLLPGSHKALLTNAKWVSYKKWYICKPHIIIIANLLLWPDSTPEWSCIPILHETGDNPVAVAIATRCISPSNNRPHNSSRQDRSDRTKGNLGLGKLISQHRTDA